ncbi:MAG: restriction endonuclease subunit S [Betaproteobacteria bacterium]|nr:restriction endonuclease subunit S [Betaproteobacteria bacterium]
MRFKPYPKYKSSGVEWLGHIPSNWEMTRLKRISQVRLSNVDKHSIEGQKYIRLCNYVDVYRNRRITSEIEFMTATASDEQIARLTLSKGDVIITKDSESPSDIGVPALVNEDITNLVCGYHLALIRPMATSGQYLCYLLMSHFVRAVFEMEATGMTRYALGKYSIENLVTAIPPDSEQSAIASFLDCETAKIDTLIAKQEKLIELLKEKRQAIISHAVTKGLNPNVRMKDSGVEWLGEVPEHWSVVQSRRLFSERNEKAINSDKQLTASQKYGVIYQDQFMSLEGQKVVQVITGSDILKHVEPGDFVISMRSFQGGIESANDRGSISSAYVMLKPEKNVYPKFFSYLFKSRLYIQSLQRTSNLVRDGQALRFSNFSQVSLPIVPEMEQRTIASFIDQEIAKIDTLIAKSEQAISLQKEHRTALISAAVTGKIDVRDVA